MFVTRIRKKLGADVITTIRGLGYRLEDPEREVTDRDPRRAERLARAGSASLTPAHDRRRGDLDHGLLLLGGGLRARPGADQLARRELRQAAGVCPQRHDRGVGDRSGRRGALQPPAGRPALPRALFGRLFPGLGRRRRHLPVAFAVGPAAGGSRPATTMSTVTPTTATSSRTSRCASSSGTSSCPGPRSAGASRWRNRARSSTARSATCAHLVRAFAALGIGLSCWRRCRRSTAFGPCAA